MVMAVNQEAQDIQDLMNKINDKMGDSNFKLDFNEDEKYAD